MIAEVLNRDVVLTQLAELREFVAHEREQHRQDGHPTSEDDLVLAELNAAEAREHAASSGQPSFEAPDGRRGAESAPLDDFAFVSRDPVISLFQSALDAQYDLDEHQDKVLEESPPDDRRGGGAALVTDRKLVST